MVDFLIISTRTTKNGVDIYPKFRLYPKSQDLMIRGGDFYAVWVEELGLWSTVEDDALAIIDSELKKYADEYAKKYPDVIFEYTDKVSKIDPTVELRFMTGPEEDADLFYRVLGKKNSSKIGFLISADGPTGAAIKTPIKGDTSEWTYTFSVIGLIKIIRLTNIMLMDQKILKKEQETLTKSLRQPT